VRSSQHEESTDVWSGVMLQLIMNDIPPLKKKKKLWKTKEVVKRKRNEVKPRVIIFYRKSGRIFLVLLDFSIYFLS
jgi:hypothetical protein